MTLSARMTAMDGATSNANDLLASGPVVDIKFDSDSLPNLYNGSIHINLGDSNPLVAEVEQHMGDDIVKTIAMEATEGLRRGMEAKILESLLKYQLEKMCFGRLFNVLEMQ